VLVSLAEDELHELWLLQQHDDEQLHDEDEQEQLLLEQLHEEDELEQLLLEQLHDDEQLHDEDEHDEQEQLLLEQLHEDEEQEQLENELLEPPAPKSQLRLSPESTLPAPVASMVCPEASPGGPNALLKDTST